MDDWNVTDMTNSEGVRKKANTLTIDGRCVIGDAGRLPASGRKFTTGHPAARQEVGNYFDAEGLAQRAVDSSLETFQSGSWANESIAARATVFLKWADLIDQHAERLALTDTLEMGMPISQSLGDVGVTSAAIRDLAALAKTLTTEAGVTKKDALLVNIRSPLGVIVAITPWNFPLNQAVVKICPALIMGNSVVLKPSEVAPGSALILADLALEAGIPPGVLNVLTGLGSSTGAALVKCRGVDKITFTGSTVTGAAIQRLAASEQPTPVIMELGGKSPQVVCASFEDIEGIAPILAHNVFWNSGQVCTAGSKLIVHESVADELMQALCEAARAYVPSDPLDPETLVGPLATQTHYESVRNFMSQAETVGAKPISGGCKSTDELDSLGVAPTIYDAVPDEAELSNEEVFGPVLTVSRFETTAEAIQLAKSSGYALTATAWTHSLSEGHALARELPGATVTINAHSGPLSDFSSALGFEPAGRSGFGSEYGLPGLNEYSQLKLAIFNAMEV